MYPRANVYIDVEIIGKPMVSRSEKDLQMVGKTNIYCMLVTSRYLEYIKNGNWKRQCTTSHGEHAPNW